MAKKVLFVESGEGYGGSAFSLLRLVRSLDRARYEPHVVAFHGAEPFEKIAAAGVPVKIIRIFRPLFGCVPERHTVWGSARNYCSVYGNLLADALYNGISLARHIRSHKIDLVHLNNGMFENLCAAFAARMTHTRCVSHVRGTEPIPWIEKQVAGWVAAIITLNSAVRNDYARAFGCEKVHLICNGVDLNALQSPNVENIRQEFEIHPGTFAVGTFARLVEGKGITEFITAAARVSTEHRQCRFFIVGDDPTEGGVFEARVRKLAADMGLDGRLVFTGWRNDRIDIMAAMDLVLQISTTFPEGMSLAPLEAMALGKPVIVTDIPGYEFCVDDGRTGFIVKPGDIHALTEKVLRLAWDKDLAHRLGQEGCCKARREFDVRITARRVQEVYDRVLDH